MEFESIIQAVLHFFEYSDNIGIVLWAVATAVLTYLLKRLFLDKINVELFKRLNIKHIVPFLFAVCFAVIDLLVFKKLSFDSQFVYLCLLDCATIGTLASVLVKIAGSIEQFGLSHLLKDSLLNILCSRVDYFVNLYSKLKSRQIKLADFLKQVKEVVEELAQIYQSSDDDSQKLEKLYALLAEFSDGQCDQQAVADIHQMLLDKYSAKVEYEEQTKE